MACINPDGTLSWSAKLILEAMQEPATLEDVAKQVKLPLFRVRSSVREISEAGLVTEADGNYTTTKAGLERINTPPDAL